MNNQNMDLDNTQFVLSYELLCLLRWLVDNHPNQLQQLITKALSSGLYAQIQKQIHNRTDHQIEQDNEITQHSIVDFFSELENILHEQISRMVQYKAQQQDLLSTIDHIDGEACDQDIVRESIEKVTAHNRTTSPADAKELLYKELLKRWKPHDKKRVN
jgi:hypothetical protein